jgi:CDP-4-dehydro-6-deoxyglucose reductase
MVFTVTLKPSGRTFTVEPQEKILEAAMRQGITLPYSCRNGSCGTCKGTLLAGDVDRGQYEEKALSVAEREAGKLLLCQARALSDVTVEARELVTPPGIVIKTLAARVLSLERAAHDVMILRLKLPENMPLAFLAGQYMEFLLKDNQRRSFSFANSPQVREFVELHIRQVPGGMFTDHVFSKMQERDLVRLRGPLGTFFLREDSTRPIVFVAGGTGFAPIKSIIEHAIEKGIRRPMHLYWGVRAKRDLYLHALAESWSEKLPDFRFTPVLSEPRPEDGWTGRTGFVHAALAHDYPQLGEHEVYACGPPPMIEALKRTTAERGLPAERLFFDSFEFAHIG